MNLFRLLGTSLVVSTLVFGTSTVEKESIVEKAQGLLAIPNNLP